MKLRYTLVPIILTNFILKNLFTTYIFFSLLFISGQKLNAQTTLLPGKGTILWNQNESPNGFTFVTFLDMWAGTMIYFIYFGADIAEFQTIQFEGIFKYIVQVVRITTKDNLMLNTTTSDRTVYTYGRIIDDFNFTSAGDLTCSCQNASNPGIRTNARINTFFNSNASTKL
jgi:hypothetical protein